MILREASPSIDKILLDPNNPRFAEIATQEPPPRIDEARFADRSVQESTMERFFQGGDMDVRPLKDSIRTNGYLPIESIVVKPWRNDRNCFVTIEGNRRIAAMKSLLKDFKEGLPVSEEIVEQIEKPRVLVFEGKGNAAEDQAIEMIIQGIRHISGPISWGPYQRAKLIECLKDRLDFDFAAIQEKLALKKGETVRYYRTVKILEKMATDDEFGGLARPDLFSLFEEAMKKKSIREWLGWNEKILIFENQSNLKSLYELITVDEQNGHKEPIISNPGHMRKFAEILEHPSVLTRVLNGTLEIEEAHFLLHPPNKLSWREVIQETIKSLNAIPISDLKSMKVADRKLLTDVIAKVQETLKDADALSSHQKSK